jgi:hypothetical protein
VTHFSAVCAEAEGLITVINAIMRQATARMRFLLYGFCD